VWRLELAEENRLFNESSEPEKIMNDHSLTTNTR
jgi:hypothetical protein